MTGALSPEALLKSEARERARLLSNFAYDVALDLTRGNEVFGCETVVEFDSAEPGTPTFIDLTAREVVRAELNGREIDATTFTGYRLPLVPDRDRNTLRIEATCSYSRSGAGLHFFRDPVDGNVYLHSQCEAREAHKIFPCFDQPDLKATFDLRVSAPAGWHVVSNTAPTERPPDGEAGAWRFGRTRVMSTYLIAIVAGPYHVVRDRHRSIDLGVWCRQSLAQYLDAAEIFEVTKQGFDFFEKLFDYPYAFGKYDQLFVPEFNSGAMENPGAVTFNESMIHRSKVTDAAHRGRASTILHEMAHMWFGDLVTMEWWDDLWLNESFATYMGTLALARATRWRDSWTMFAFGTKSSAYRADQLPTTHPIVADVPDTETARTNFDGISYAKGASVLKQLVAWVGEEAFAEGCRRYFRDHEWRNATLADFLAAVEKASGRDLGQWSREWLETAGANTFGVVVEERDGVYAGAHLDQTAPERWPTLRSHRIAVGLYDSIDGKLARRRLLEVDAAGARTPLPELTGEAVADLVLPNDGDLTYAKIRLDARSWETLRTSLAGLDDSLARALCWSAAGAQLLDAELAPRHFRGLVLNNVHVETDPSVVSMLLALARLAAGRYANPAERDGARGELATRALDELRSAEPGSDLQLVWAKQFIANARRPDHVATARGLLEGTTSFEGLTVDTGLRWEIVTLLARVGADEGLIDAELERDPTDAGRRNATTARASRPIAAAKEEAFAALLDAETTLAMRRAYAGGFNLLDQEDIVAAFESRYFDALIPLWESRPIEVAVMFCRAMYPALLASAGLVDRTERFLAEHPDLAPPLRRYLLEGKHEAERILRCREADRGASD